MDFKSIALTTRPPQPSCSFDGHELVYIQYSVTSASMVQTTRMQAYVMHIGSGMCCRVRHACRQLASILDVFMEGNLREVSTYLSSGTTPSGQQSLQPMLDHQHGPAGQQARLSTEQHAWLLT